MLKPHTKKDREKSFQTVTFKSIKDLVCISHTLFVCSNANLLPPIISYCEIREIMYLFVQKTTFGYNISLDSNVRSKYRIADLVINLKLFQFDHYHTLATHDLRILNYFVCISLDFIDWKKLS